MGVPVSAPSYRVLVIEDDGVAAAVLTHTLERSGRFSVDFTGDPAQGLAMLRAMDWDLLIVDVGLPGISGLELIRSLPPDRKPPTIVITGSPSLDVAVEALRSAADDFLAKPVDSRTLVEKALELAARPRRREGFGRDPRSGADAPGRDPAA